MKDISYISYDGDEYKAIPGCCRECHIPPKPCPKEVSGEYPSCVAESRSDRNDVYWSKVRKSRC